MNRVQIENGQRPCLPCQTAARRRPPLPEDTHGRHVLPILPSSIGRIWKVVDPVAGLPAGTLLRLYDVCVEVDSVDVQIEIQEVWWLMMALGPTNAGTYFVDRRIQNLDTDHATPPDFLEEIDPDPPGDATTGSPTRTADDLATECVEMAAVAGFDLVLRPQTPIIPDEAFPFASYPPTLTRRGTWGELDALLARWSDAGCRWVNLRFGIERDGSAIVRYEAKPDGWPNEGGTPPQLNGGFDPPAHRVLQRVGPVRG